MTDLPEPYDRLVMFIEHDIGLVLDESPSNMAEICEHIGWTYSQVAAALGILKAKGIISADRTPAKKRRRWKVVKANGKAA